MSKRYYEYSEAERVALTPEQTLDAVKIEAISRGIRPPLASDEALASAGYAGFQIPANSARVFEVVNTAGYSRGTGLVYKTLEEAERAIIGGLGVGETYRAGKTVTVLQDAVLSVQTRYVGVTETTSFLTKLQEYVEAEADVTAFEKLSEECRDDQARIKQAAYDKAVRSRKRAEYLQLARGDEAIAAAFWRKVESGEFPSE